MNQVYQQATKRLVFPFILDIFNDLFFSFSSVASNVSATRYPNKKQSWCWHYLHWASKSWQNTNNRSFKYWNIWQCIKRKGKILRHTNAHLVFQKKEEKKTAFSLWNFGMWNIKQMSSEQSYRLTKLSKPSKLDRTYK